MRSINENSIQDGQTSDIRKIRFILSPVYTRDLRLNIYELVEKIVAIFATATVVAFLHDPWVQNGTLSLSLKHIMSPEGRQMGGLSPPPSTYLCP